MREPFVMNPHLRESGKVRPSLPQPRLPLDLGPSASGLARFYIQQIRRAAESGLIALEALHSETAFGIRLDDLGHHFEEVIAGCQRAINPPEEDDDEEPEEPTVVYEEPKESAN